MARRLRRHLHERLQGVTPCGIEFGEIAAPMRLRGDVTRGALARQAVRITRCNDQVCLTVTDQGPGIAPEMLAWMFKAFIPQDIAHHMSGHRLSLAIAQQIVLAHDGTIQVGSTPGVETTFTVRLPEGADAEIS